MCSLRKLSLKGTQQTGNLQIPQLQFTIMINLKDMLSFIPTASSNHLRKLLKAAEAELLRREDTVELVHDVCDDRTLRNIWSECESLKLDDDNRKAPSQWLSQISEPYIYPDSNPVHNAKVINLFPGSTNLLEQINNDPQYTGPLDSCLILKYSSSSTSISIHADDEDCIDQTKSICNFNIGATREIEFFEKYGTKPGVAGKHVKSVVMENNSITHMKPGTQQVLKHLVRGSQPGIPEKRYSISLRGLTKLRDSSGNAQCVEQPSPNSNKALTSLDKEQSTPKRHICLIAGDSYAARLDATRLGRNSLCVENIAVGGATIPKVTKQLEDFVTKNNDVRFCSQGINHLRGPLKQFCNRLRELFPSTTKIYFQSLLPLPCNNSYDWITNTNVIEFNRFIFNECIFWRFYYIDAFDKFVLPQWNRWSPHIRDNGLFEVGGIHPHTRALGLLAKLYIRALHSRYFDPYVFQ